MNLCSHSNNFIIIDHHHHHILAILEIIFIQIQQYGRARRPPRNHQAYRGGHPVCQYVCNNIKFWMCVLAN